MTSGVKITGLRELERTLKKLEPKNSKNVLRAAIRAAGRVVVVEARQNLPSEYDTLSRSLTHKLLKQRSAVRMNLIVGPTTGEQARYNGWYAHLVEFGVAPHPIPKGNGRRIMNIGDGEVATKVQHPGVKKRPFLRPALDNNLEKIKDAYIAKLWAGIKKKLPL